MSFKRWSGRDPKERIADVLEAINEIRSYIAGLSAQQFASDSKTRSAVERQLLTIAEACSWLVNSDESIETRYPNVPWRKAIGMGNRLRHEYGRTDSKIVWDTVKAEGDLAVLEQAMRTLQKQ